MRNLCFTTNHRWTLIVKTSFVVYIILCNTRMTTAASERSHSTMFINETLWPIIDFRSIALDRYSLSYEENQTMGPAGDTSSAMTLIVPEVQRALLTRGFFFARIDLNLSLVYETSQKAHNLDLSLKRSFAGRGYTGPDVDVHELAYEPGKRSTVAAYDYAKEYNTFVDPSKFLYPEFLEPVVSALFDWQARFGKLLLSTFEQALGLPPHSFAKYMERELGSLRLLRYPPTEIIDSNLTGISAHTDFEAFTTMHQNAIGLQVRARKSTAWETVPLVSDNAILVIMGDVMERLTNGVLLATPHRVVPTPHERYSIIRFHAFAGDTIVAPLPEFVTANRPSQYSATTMEEIMRVVTNNLHNGIGAWDSELDQSATTKYDYGPDDKSCLMISEQEENVA